MFRRLYIPVFRAAEGRLILSSNMRTKITG